MGEKQLERKVFDGTLTGFIDPYKVEKYRTDLTRVCLIKLSQRLYHASLFVQVDTLNPDRLLSLLMIDNQIVAFDRPQFGSLGLLNVQPALTVNDAEADWKTSALGQYSTFTEQHKSLWGRNKRPVEYDLILEAREIAALWHLPHEEFTAPTIQWSYGTVRSPPVMPGKRDGICIGENILAGRTLPIFCARANERHPYRHHW